MSGVLPSSRRSSSGAELHAHALNRAAQQARYVHLRDPDLIGDLSLREALKEPQQDDAALARRERREDAPQLGALLGSGEARILGSESLSAGAAVRRFLERHGVVGLGALHRLEHVLD